MNVGVAGSSNISMVPLHNSCWLSTLGRCCRENISINMSVNNYAYSKITHNLWRNNFPVYIVTEFSN